MSIIDEMGLNVDFVRHLKMMKYKYGEKFEYLNGLHDSQLNHMEFISHFTATNSVADSTIDSSANTRTKDITSLKVEKEKSNDKLLAFNKIFYELNKEYGLETAKQWLEMEWDGSLYLHDASSSTYVPYCYAYDSKDLAEKGLYFIDAGKAKPAKHLTTWCDHLLEFVSWASNRTSGACGLPSFLIYSYYFWKKDIEEGCFLKSPEWYRDQCFQKVIFDLNQPYLRITQSAFTNVSIFDRNYIEELFGDRVYPDGSLVIDSVDEIIEFQKAFMRVVSKVRETNMMTFPVITYSLLYKDGKYVDEEFARWCCMHNMKWNDANFFNSDNVGVLSNCCRLLSDTKELDPFINSIGGTALSVGSVKVNTVNLRRVSLLSGGDKELYFKILDKHVDVCIKALKTIRHIIKRNVEKGLLPIYQQGLIEMEKQFSTLGITAIYEVLRDYNMINVDRFGNHSYTDEGLEFVIEILDFLNKKKASYGFDFKINIECVPAERANNVLAEKDAMLFPDSEFYGMYSNQWIALTDKTTIAEKIRLGAILDIKCGGGTIAHINLEGPIEDEETAWELLNKIAKAGVIYFAFNVRINTCHDGHSFYTEKCPLCGEPVEDTWQRIVGYIVPYRGFSAPRKKEFDKRQWLGREEF